MKLITKELEQRFAEIGEQNNTENPVFIAKFFNPCGAGTWYASEYNPKTKICYGYVTGLGYDEWGTFSITELEAVELPFGLKIERDIFFDERTFDLIKSQEVKIPSTIKIKRESELKKKDSKDKKSQEFER